MLSSTACSGGGRDYAVPGDLCGVTVDSQLVSPLLPDGKKLTQRSSNASATSPRCRVSVDGDLVLYISSDLVSPGTDPLQVQDRGLQRLGHPLPADVGDSARVADRGAMAVADCTRRGGKQRIATLIQLEKEHPKDASQRRKDLTRLLRAYLPKAMAGLDCSKTST
ncbi:hypothetical protein NHG22_22000 [Streptomyces sp. ATE26]|uniref:hypothetical protein n=1 Tax=Streptomyces sp. ATE26 TaxID=2954237 RepID=UPI002482E295|nr:hypothetical protein [Streptomyces sp. ATE26]MDI1456469.1 hypothetical protein [Streptomyces sp. ATE26]